MSAAEEFEDFSESFDELSDTTHAIAKGRLVSPSEVPARGPFGWLRNITVYEAML